MDNKLPKLSDKEKDILSVLWQSNKPLTASEIVEIGDKLNINTVQAAMRNLMKKKYIKVADIVYSGTVLTRCYTPIVSAEQYAAEQLEAIWSNTFNFSALNFIEHFKKIDDLDVLGEFEEIIRKRGKEGGD